MQAIILASGSGSRLKPLTNLIPKCLVKITNFSILDRLLDSLLQNNISDVIITTGHFDYKIRAYVKKYFPQIKPTYVRNDKYNSTNYIYSLWLAKNFITDDVITLHGDLVFDVSLMKKVVKNRKKNCVLINKEIDLPKKDFKARIKNNVIHEIGVNIFGQDAGFCIPIYKFAKNDWDVFMEEINNFVLRGQIDCYAENAFNNITHKIQMHPLYYNKEFAMEIDDFEDLEKAKKYFK